jgi:hypothetical protein
MSHAVLSHSDRPSGVSAIVAAAVLAAWLALVLSLGARGAFVSPPGTSPLPLLAAVVLPVMAFLAAFRLSRVFRDFVLAVDLSLMASIQAWRVAGFGFLALYAHGILPAAFALPAGLGDIAIGAVAPWMALFLARERGFAASGAFRLWNLLGMLDLIVAVSIGALSSALAAGTPGEVSAAPMALLPLVLVPAYLVPIFFMLHVAALRQARVRP